MFSTIKLYAQVISLEVILISMVGWLDATRSLVSIGVSLAGIIVALLTGAHLYEKIQISRLERKQLEYDIKDRQEAWLDKHHKDEDQINN